MRQLRIQNEEVAFGELDLQAHGVANCPTCQDRPCQVRLGWGAHVHRPPPATPSPLLIPAPPPQNGGICEDAESSTYVCRCPHGFTGSNCEYSQALHCHPGGCLPRGDVTRCPPWLDAGPPPALTAHLCPLPGQRRAGLMPPASTGRTGRATAAAATWASLGRGAPKVSTAGDGGTGLGALRGQGHGGGDNPRDVDTGLGPPWGHKRGDGMTVGTWAWGHGRRGGDYPGATSMGMGVTLGTWAQGWVPQWGDGHKGTQAGWGQGTRNHLGRWASWM